MCAFNNESIYTGLVNHILQGSTDIDWMGRKSYQVYATLCLFLLKPSFYRKLKELSTYLKIPHFDMPDGNQWTLQYKTLFGC